tara:strand:- start:528 stop:779 length:252 start_codon:yes stop_codon:yes gene_type:complete
MGQNSQPKTGDLVRYTKTPKYIIPTNEHPIGIILGNHSLLIGKDHKHQAIMEMVKVRWSIGKWNSSGGFSVEHPDDLVIIQRS